MDVIPYCGPAPLPEEFWASWNLDPWLVTALVGGATAHALLLQREAPNSRRHKAWLAAAGWGVLVLIFVSPLCALTSALFAARVAHHVLLVAVAAPLFALALPERWRHMAPAAGAAGIIFVLHTAAMWIWHAPAPYAAALANHAVFWSMELTLFATALLLWQAVLSPRSTFVTTMSTLLGTIVQMCLLGALITFAREPLYAPHFWTTEPFGLTALADQQLAGLIMWVPGTVPYLIAGLAIAAYRLGRLPAHDRTVAS